MLFPDTAATGVTQERISLSYKDTPTPHCESPHKARTVRVDSVGCEEEVERTGAHCVSPFTFDISSLPN